MGSGFFAINLSSEESLLPIDDTYSYYLYQEDELTGDDNILKHGYVRLAESTWLVNNGFDYTFDFLLN